MHSRCEDIVKKFYKSQGRGKTHDNYQKRDKNPRRKLNPTLNGLVTEPGKNPSLSGHVTEQGKNPSLSGPVTEQGKNPSLSSPVTIAEVEQILTGSVTKVDTELDKYPSLSGTDIVIGAKSTPINTVTKADITGCAIEPETPKNPQG